MAEDSLVALFVPLVVLVVTRLCDTVREMDLIAVHGQQSWRIPFIPGSARYGEIPALGRFTYIHAANYLIFTAVAVWLLFTPVPGSLAWPTTLFIAVIWALYPLLEVNEYDRITAHPFKQIPDSYRHHSVSVFANIGLIWWASTPMMQSLGVLETVLFGGVVTLSILWGIINFLNDLGDEILAVKEAGDM
ncbi:hypothetical protein [Halomarina rubra]|uniref:Uncharacterized protein n=1 Tax=Halomarina rubra TaxID=2071873 RepID=A0ABD6ATJ1_9EURY|nr:hypothetical protein [Halomarina rubra]